MEGINVVIFVIMVERRLLDIFIKCWYFVLIVIYFIIYWCYWIGLGKDVIIFGGDVVSYVNNGNFFGGFVWWFCVELCGVYNCGILYDVVGRGKFWVLFCLFVFFYFVFVKF